MTTPMRVGFVGAGGIARAHAEALASVPDCQIVGVTDVDPNAAQTLAAKVGASHFDTPENLAQDGGIDAMFILIPPFAHGEPEAAALRHGIPFFVEKPIGLDTGLMAEIASEVAAKALPTSVGYMNRYRKSVQRARQLFDEEPAILAYGGWWGGTPGSHPWWTDRTKSGGQFHEQATHTVDLARYFFGDADEVFAVAANGFNKGIAGYSMDDAVTVAIKFRDGGVANLMASVSSNAGGNLFLNIHSLSRNFHFTDWEHNLSIQTKNSPAEVLPGEPNIFAVEDAAFLDALRTGDHSKIQSNYADGMKSAALSLAANLSLTTGKPVEL